MAIAFGLLFQSKGVNMKKILSMVAILSLCFVSKSFAFLSGPQLIPCDWDFYPYIGADVQRRELSYGNNHGNNVFKKKARHTNVYVGTKLCDNFGVEMGYEMTGKTTRNVTLLPGQFEVGGVPIGPGSFQDTYGGTQFHGWHFDLVGFLRFPDCSNLELFGSVGTVNLKAKMVSITLADENGPVFPNPIRTFSDNKSLVRVMGGFQYTFCYCLGLRATIGFENTERFNHLLADPHGNPAMDSIVYARIKNSIIYGIGAFLHF